MTRDVICCAQCGHCYELYDTQTEYTGAGDGAFYCGAWDLEFYAPDYRAEEWFCADAIKRGEEGEGMK